MSRGKKNRTKKPEETKIVEEVRETAVSGEMEKPEDTESANTEVDKKPEETSEETSEDTEGRASEDTEEKISENTTEEKISEDTEEKSSEDTEGKKSEKNSEMPDGKGKSEEAASEEKSGETDGDKNESLYEQEPFVDPSVYRQRKRKRTIRTVITVAVAVLLAVYIGGVIFHMRRFGMNTTINGMDVSGKSVKSVERMLLTDAGTYTLDIRFKDDAFKFALGDADSQVALTESVDTLLKKHSPFLWFANAFYQYDYKVGYTVSCDKEKLEACLQASPALDPASMKASTDAKVVLEDGEAKVIPEETGTKLDTAKLYDKVLNALHNYDTTLDVEAAECYIPAHILADSESILKTKEAADAFVDIEAVYDFGSYTYTIPKEELTKMAYVSSDGSIRISKSNVAAYVEKFSEKFTTADTDREFTTHDKKTILVHGGYYGWVIDTETETEELYELLAKKKSFTKEPACKRCGYTLCEQNDIGSTYVEIDLSNQHVYYYQNGRLKWDSDCVSGQTPGHKTPGGLYGLTYKKMHATLIGEDYETPVAYWMPFNGGIGLHDANWRGKFGGEIYTYSGSHGCVNLPVDKAAELYEYVEAGMPIVCYWRDEVTFVNK